MMLSSNTILQNRYRIVRELGHGGMGTVYEAIDQRVNSLVAVKQTVATRGGQAGKAFEREAELLANLRHQSLPKVMDYFSENGSDFLVMEFIPGYDLAELLDLRGTPFPQSQVLRWANELLRVLEFLHNQDPPILHRDIKPANLKLTKQGEVFLLDFGLAKGSVGQMPTLTTSRSVRGFTPVYASLEQILGHGTDARSDIYSLGATLYHLLAGVAPVDAPARFHALEEGEPDPLPPIHKINNQTSENVCGVIHQSMAVNRRQRPSSVAELRKALRNAIEEDERSNAEEEYRRAEVKRRERDQQKEQAAAEAAKRADEAHLLEEAKTQKKSGEAQPSKEAERVKQAREQAVTERVPTQAPVIESVPAATVKGPEPQPVIPANTPQDNQSTPLETLRAPASEKVARADAQTYQSRRIPPKTSRRLAIFSLVLVLPLIAGAFVGWLLLKTSNRAAAVSNQNALVSNPTTPNDNPNNAPSGMVYVPGGTFFMGRNRNEGGDEYEAPAHQVTVAPFFMDLYEVTNEQYLDFVKATKHRIPMTWTTERYPIDEAHKPVTGVSWDDANDYAKWVGKRLPSEEEWEFAARGTDGRRYPWGNQWDPQLVNANANSRAKADVGTYKGVSPFGVYDMVGNVWEWTASNLVPYPGGRLPKNVSDDLRIIRGGSYTENADQATTTYRGFIAKGSRYDKTGFRCVADVSASSISTHGKKSS